jgi:hypothetical protein
MIGTLVLYGLALVGLVSILASVAVFVLTWRLPERTDPGVIDEQRHEFEHAQWRNNVRVAAANPAGNVVDLTGTPVPFTGPLFGNHTLDVPCFCGGDHNPASAS